MISDTDIAFIAGLFDGEGCITYKQYMRKRKHNKRMYYLQTIHEKKKT